jgi:hypothetical protein
MSSSMMFVGWLFSMNLPTFMSFLSSTCSVVPLVPRNLSLSLSFSFQRPKSFGLPSFHERQDPEHILSKLSSVALLFRSKTHKTLEQMTESYLFPSQSHMVNSSFSRRMTSMFFIYLYLKFSI